MTVTSASFTPTANSLLLASVYSETGGVSTPNIPTVTSSGLTWEQVATVAGTGVPVTLKSVSPNHSNTPANAIAEIEVPAGTEENDLLVVVCFPGGTPQDDAGRGILAADWTKHSSASQSIDVYYKFADAVEQASYPFSLGVFTSNTTAGIAKMMCFADVNLSDPFAEVATISDETDTSSPFQVGRLTTTSDYDYPGSMQVVIGGFINRDNSDSIPTMTFASPLQHLWDQFSMARLTGIESSVTLAIGAIPDFDAADRALLPGGYIQCYATIDTDAGDTVGNNPRFSATNFVLKGRSLARVSERHTLFRAQAPSSPSAITVTATFDEVMADSRLLISEFTTVRQGNNGADAIGAVATAESGSPTVPTGLFESSYYIAAKWSNSFGHTWQDLVKSGKMKAAWNATYDSAPGSSGLALSIYLELNSYRVALNATVRGEAVVSSTGLKVRGFVSGTAVGVAVVGAELTVLGAIQVRVPPFVQGKYAPQYEVWLVAPDGRRIGLLPEWERLEYARRVNELGNFSITLKPELITDLGLLFIEPDSRIEIYRSPVEGQAPMLDTQTVYFVRKIQRTLTENGQQNLILSGPSAVEILTRRIAAYPAGHEKAEVDAAAAETSMVKVVKENFGPTTHVDDVARDVSDSLYSVDVGWNRDFVVVKEYSHRNIHEVLKDLSAASITLGDPTYFDVVKRSDTVLEFRTYLGQRGMDRGLSSGSPLEFSPDRGNLLNAIYEEDYTDEASYVYVGGQGQEEDRLIVELEDEFRSRRSPFGRREIWKDARDKSTKKSLTSEARSALKEHRARTRIFGKIIDTPQARYGIDWNWGDKVIVSAFGLQQEVLLQGIHVQVTNDGKEDIATMWEDE